MPVFTVLTDVTNADDDDLVRIRAEWSSLLAEVGINAKGATVHLVEVNRYAPETTPSAGSECVICMVEECEVDVLLLQCLALGLSGFPESDGLVPCCVCSFAKTVRGHTHRQTGVKELMSMLLNSLDPLDALTFARMPGIFTPSRKRKRTEDSVVHKAEDIR